MSAPRKVVAFAVAIGAVVVSAQVTAAKPKPPVVTGEGTCDVDGVRVSYATAFVATPAPADHRVTHARVRNMSETCLGAEVRVELRNGLTVLASGSATSEGQNELDVAMTSAPRAKDVTAVHVELDGGKVPLPDQCSRIVIEHVRIGTNGADSITGTNANDLIYALDGNDTVTGGNKLDCIIGGNHNDTINGATQDDVLLGGAGDDTLDGGDQVDKLYGEGGNDVLRGGNQNDHLDGGPGTDQCIGGNGTDTFAGCEQVTQ